CQKSFEQVAILPLIEEVFIQGFRETEEEKRPRRKKSPQRALKGFVSYAHEDRDYQKEFSKHLDILKRTNILDTWVDSEILAGQAWDEEIMSKLEEADVIFLLISIDFLTSDFIQTEELRVAMKKHEAKTARVIPIILRECAWKNQEFAKLQAANTRPVADMDKDKAWTAIDQEIRRSIANFLEE
ncbi:MAG: toll/interleukin-1 receptor domain-containing protein, partial [Bacteroidota bacterium]